MNISQSPGRVLATAAARPRSSGLRRFLALCLLAVFLIFFALGCWQVKRLFWKLDLIARVDQRVHAVAQAAPGPAVWPQISADRHEYLHVSTAGTYLYSQTARVQALTRLGAGYWLLTPLRRADGVTILINRGYVTTGAPDLDKGRADAPVQLSGLLRISEPRGGFLRHNDAAADRWFSRDVAVIAATRKLTDVAPYFIDAEADAAAAANEMQSAASGMPVGGLTVISFPNNHLVYALTWYALALMTAGACFWIMRDERRRRSPESSAQESNDGKQA